MGSIRLLGDQIINRIAAGEVVERPASVAKELVENSLDAGADSISISLEGGGKKLIRIADNGCGMDRDDALLALERHATSKLASMEDLNTISTLGFRGEALSSIAAVSRFKLDTAVENGKGSRIVVHGGRIISAAEAGLPRGSVVEVGRLFYNMPARRKFMRADSTELSHIVRWVARYALASTAVRFQLEQGGRYLIRATPGEDRLQRIAEIYGRELAEQLVPFEGGAERLSLSGFTARPVDSSARKDRQHLFVNGRAVQDRVLAHAIHEAYGNTVPRGRFPAVFLFIEIDPAGVDVNVHPQKTEVRFSRPSMVHDLLRETLSAALSTTRSLPSYGQLRPGSAPAHRAEAAHAISRYLELNEHLPGDKPFVSARAKTGERETAPQPAELSSAGEATRIATNLPLGLAGEEESAEAAVPLVQYHDSYIVAQDPQGLLLVDQHAAHERVIFERYLAEANANNVEMQRLLFPVTVELAAHEMVLLQAEMEEFQRLGFEIEPFGGNTVRVEAVPALAAETDPAELLKELLGEASSAPSAVSEVAQLRRRLITSAACQAAIKINHPLTQPKMQGLLEDLYRTQNPSTCPHGRPTVFRLTLEEIERTFRRR